LAQSKKQGTFISSDAMLLLQQPAPPVALVLLPTLKMMHDLEMDVGKDPPAPVVTSGASTSILILRNTLLVANSSRVQLVPS